ncbi:MAG: LptF/LptG family permease [Planctomycetota bacterium]
MLTRIDRYIAVLFLRTVAVCFLSLAGIIIVFHAFSELDKLLAAGGEGQSVLVTLLGFYVPYLVLLFDMTGAVITLMAFLFTVGWLRRSGELTATLSAGVSHGRLLRPMIIASGLIVLLQWGSRELVLPHFRDALSMKGKGLAGEVEQTVSPTYDRSCAILIEGARLKPQSRVILMPNFRLYGDYGDFGENLGAKEAVWWDGSLEPDSMTPAQAELARRGGLPDVTGYLLQGVAQPKQVDRLASTGFQTEDRDSPITKAVDVPVLYTAADTPWIRSNECFVRTTVAPPMLQADDSSKKLASTVELAARIRNPAIHSPLNLEVMLHERIVRAPLDFALIMMVLPLVASRHSRRLFTVIAVAFGIVLGFFAVKTLAATLASGGIIVSPGIGAWVPLLVFGPLAYVRLRHVQTV